MNELIFFIHIALVVFFLQASLKLGRSALVTWIVLQAILANLFVVKQMVLFGLNVTCSDVFAIGSILGLNVLQERYDRVEAVSASKICFLFLLFFALMSQVHLIYQPSIHDTSQFSYHTIFSSAPRLVASSLFTFYIVQQFDMRLFSWIKKKRGALPFAVRSLISLLLCQLLDTTLFSFLGLYGTVLHLWDVILFSYLVKVAVIACTSISYSLTQGRRSYDYF